MKFRKNHCVYVDVGVGVGGYIGKGGFRLMVLCMRPLGGMLYLRLKKIFNVIIVIIFLFLFFLQQNFVVDVSDL